MTNEESEKLLRAACEFQGKSLAAREACRDRYRRDEPKETNILRILIDGQIGGLADRLTQRINSPNAAISYQIGVSASFVRTHFIVSDMILNGDLVEAMVLIRKQLESLARLHELDSKPLERLLGKVPNIGNVLKGTSGRMYGELSEIAHFSTPRVVELLHVYQRGELVGPSLLPVCTPHAAAAFDMEHFIAMYFIAWMTEKLPTWYPGYNNTNDKTILGMTVGVALDAGVVHDSSKGTT